MIDFVMTDENHIAAHWNNFCDDAAVPPSFASWDEFAMQMEGVGLARVVEENNEMRWSLTEDGQKAFDEAFNDGWD
jgi:hypothetical protein